MTSAQALLQWDREQCAGHQHVGRVQDHDDESDDHKHRSNAVLQDSPDKHSFDVLMHFELFDGEVEAGKIAAYGSECQGTQ